MKTACRTAMRQLQAYLEQAGQPWVGADEALQHIGGCPACTSRLVRLREALRLREQDRLTCAECEDTLPAYLVALEQMHADQPGWRSLIIHLAVCAHCAAVAATLRSMLSLAHDDQVALPPSYPQPDLGFLQPMAERTRWRVSDLSRLVIELADTLLPRWQPLPAIAAGLKSGPSGEAASQIMINDAMPDLEVRIMIEPTRATADHCTLVVSVQIPSRGGFPNLGGTSVTLLRSGQPQPVAIQITNAFGEAIFADQARADLAELRVEISSGAPQ